MRVSPGCPQGSARPARRRHEKLMPSVDPVDGPLDHAPLRPSHVPYGLKAATIYDCQTPNRESLRPMAGADEKLGGWQSRQRDPRGGRTPWFLGRAIVWPRAWGRRSMKIRLTMHGNPGFRPATSHGLASCAHHNASPVWQALFCHLSHAIRSTSTTVDCSGRTNGGRDRNAPWLHPHFSAPETRNRRR